MVKVCIFCGSSMGIGEVYKNAAEEVAIFFVKNNISLVYGGANVGLMKILADILLENGKEVVGVMPGILIEKGVAHKNLSELIEVNSMAERKLKMINLSDGFIALPGGLGTLDEISEIMIFNQLHICDKPFGFLNTEGYFDKLFGFFDYAVNEGFVRKEHRNNILVSANISELISKMQKYHPFSLNNWIDDIKEEVIVRA